MPCPKCGGAGEPYNQLNQCKACHDKTIANISLRLQSIDNNIVYWMQEVERRYKSSIFYSEDLPLNHGPKRDNGCADGFIANGKNFTIRTDFSPSEAVRKFIQGTETICECQGLLLAVIYNALLDVLSIPVFDLVFRGLDITTSVRGPGGMACGFVRKTDANNEGPVRRGDWVYVLNTNIALRIELVQDGKASPAAGGWNLVCVDSSMAQKLYMGLGLADKKENISAFPLNEIKEKMLKDPTDKSEQNVPLDKEKIKQALLSGKKIDFGSSKPKPSLGKPSDIQLQGYYRISQPRLMRMIQAALRPPVLLLHEL